MLEEGLSLIEVNPLIAGPAGSSRLTPWRGVSHAAHPGTIPLE